MRTIHKFELTPREGTALVEPVMMDVAAKYLHVNVQNDRIYLWAEIETDSPQEWHNFEVFGTGHEMIQDMGVDREYVGTVLVHYGQLVFHVYHRAN